MKSFTRIFAYLGDQKKNIALYFLFNLLSIIFSLVSLTLLAPFLQLLFGKEKLVQTAPPLHFSVACITEYLKYGLSEIIRSHNNGYVYALAMICVAVIVTVFFKNVFLYMAMRVLSPMRNIIMTRLRADVFRKILELPIGYFTEQRKGDIISKMSNDINELEWSVVGTMEGLIREPMTILIILVSLVLLSPALSVFMFVLLPIMGFIIGRVSRSLKKQTNEAQEKLGTIMSILDETLGGLRVVKSFNAEKRIRDKFLGVNSGLNHLRNKMNFRRDLASPLSEVLGVLVLCGILWFGGTMALKQNGGLKADTFITYILFFTQIINPAKALSTLFYNTRRGAAAIERLETILNAPIVIEEPIDAKRLESFADSIEFRHAGFAYDEKKILVDINIKIAKGKTIALVGSSGAGKSTLADLVPRFHDVTDGELLIDGVNVKDFSLKSLRSQMSIVTQEPILFNDSIANNIALSKPGATREEIMEAAKVANAHQFIIQKENGYDTNIGDRGSKLSGGERQRITIARAVLKNPPILILDEATSSLDTESERLVQDAINNMMQNRTSIVIAHRLSTIRHADEIIVLQHGRIVERGSHDHLVQQSGFYKKLIDLQEVK